MRSASSFGFLSLCELCCASHALRSNSGSGAPNLMSTSGDRGATCTKEVSTDDVEAAFGRRPFGEGKPLTAQLTPKNATANAAPTVPINRNMKETRPKVGPKVVPAG